MRFYENDIAIVSYSGVFPDAEDESAFFKNLLDGKCSIRDLTEIEETEPLKIRYYYSKDKAEPEKTYSKCGSKIPLEYFGRWAKINELDESKCTAFEITMHELFRRMRAKVPNLFTDKRAECVIAMSTGDPYTVRVRSYMVIQRLLKKMPASIESLERLAADYAIAEDHPGRKELMLKDLFWSLSYESVRDRFGINGPCSFVDAACASSLAAFTVAVSRLKAGDTDLVISGGIDFGVAILTLSAFSRVRVLSEKIMNPFDASADGMNQGEAAAVFAMMRLKDAKAAGFPIHAVIRNCDGASDGINGGIVEPTEYGQILAYERAYRNVPLQPLSYLECHGTGTVLGDRTELASVNKYFHPLPPIGSVKANVGHTIGAAGAVATMKSLKIIESKTIPRMPNFQTANAAAPSLIHKDNHPVTGEDNVRIGVSSFGFGGANFHMVMDEYRGEDLIAPTAPATEFKYVWNGSATIDLDFVYELFASSKIKIPPVSLPHFDKTIIGAALAAEKLFADLSLRLSPQNRELVGVLSTTNNVLERFRDCYDKTAWMELAVRMEGAERERLMKEIEQKYLPITEDTFPGALSNLIAGKVTKDFDLKGVNFNIAGEKAGLGIALSYAKSMLQNRSGAYIILHTEEDVSADGTEIRQKSVQAIMVSDLDFALKADLPIAFEITDIETARITATKDVARNPRPRERETERPQPSL